MKKIIYYVLGCLTIGLMLNACKTEVDEPLLCDYKLDIAAKWYNSHVTVDSYSDATLKTKTGSVTTSTVGFLKIEPAGTYEIVSNDRAQVGTWKIDKQTCELTLDDKAVNMEDLKYEIYSVSASALAIRRTINNKVYTYYYKTANCPSIADLTAKWDNTHTYYYHYDAAKFLINNPELIYPVGYFTLNANFTYNVNSNGIPLDGSWRLGQPYCMLDLDYNNTNSRSFEVVKVTTDSLVIWRKDPVISRAYLQYYLKHK